MVLHHYIAKTAACEFGAAGWIVDIKVLAIRTWGGWTGGGAAWFREVDRCWGVWWWWMKRVGEEIGWRMWMRRPNALVTIPLLNYADNCYLRLRLPILHLFEPFACPVDG